MIITTVACGVTKTCEGVILVWGCGWEPNYLCGEEGGGILGLGCNLWTYTLEAVAPMEGYVTFRFLILGT